MTRVPDFGELPSEMREEAVVLRDEFEAMMVDGRERELDFSELLRAVHAALVRFLGRTGPDEALIEDLDEARARLDPVAGRSGSTTREQEGLVIDEARRMLAGLREKTLDHIARYPARGSSWSAPAFSASIGSPAIHEAPAVPPAELFEQTSPWDADPRVREEPTGPAPDALATPPEARDLQSWGRDALEDIGIFGNLRRLEDQEAWSSANGFEERLLVNLDALWALDHPGHPELPRLGVPAAAWSYATEWAVPDSGRAFALGFSLGCVRQSAALRWVMLGLRRSPDATLPAYVDALSLGSSPHIDEAVLELLRDAPELAMCAGLDIARRRRVFAAGIFAPLLAHPNEQVVIATIRGFRHAPATLGRQLLRNATSDQRPAVRLAALVELAAHGDPNAHGGLREVLDRALSEPADVGPGLEALRALALMGQPADEGRVLEAALAFPDAAHMLGFFGSPKHLDPLLDRLAEVRDRGGVDRFLLARLEAATRRLTGLDPGSPIPALRTLGAEQLATIAAKRVRYGLAHSRALVLDELLNPKALQGDRRDLSLELALAWPELPRIDVETWSSRQTAEILALRDWRAVV